MSIICKADERRIEEDLIEEGHLDGFHQLGATRKKGYVKGERQNHRQEERERYRGSGMFLSWVLKGVKICALDLVSKYIKIKAYIQKRK
jgi:hypothetical protein